MIKYLFFYMSNILIFYSFYKSFIDLVNEPEMKYYFISGLTVGFIIADFMAMFVHYVADNYFSEDTPIIGETIHFFREHHDKVYKLLERNVVESNWEICIVNVPYALLLYLYNNNLFVDGLLITSLIFSTYATEIHKYTHKHKNHNYFFIDYYYHNEHHKNHNKNYSLITKWQEYLLDKIYFFEIFEYMVYKLFSVKANYARNNY